jgi:hypothetical protein
MIIIGLSIVFSWYYFDLDGKDIPVRMNLAFFIVLYVLIVVLSCTIARSLTKIDFIIFALAILHYAIVLGMNIYVFIKPEKYNDVIGDTELISFPFVVLMGTMGIIKVYYSLIKRSQKP